MSDATRSTIRAIETSYAGCRFRSRLEARWAVALDELGIRWEYEAQGYEVGWRLSLEPGTFNYLPDFWLPDMNMWAEVKGDWSLAECDKFLNAAATLSGASGGCGESNVAVFGPIPSYTMWRPWVLHMHKGDLDMSPWHGLHHSNKSWTIARDVGGSGDAVYREVGTNLAELSTILLRGSFDDPSAERDMLWRQACTKARRARFEFGQTPVRPEPRPVTKVIIPPTPRDPATGRAILGGAVRREVT